MAKKPTSEETPRKAYADALSSALEKLHLTDKEYEELGAELAKEQEPPRAIPYHDFTIAGWEKGELLPTPQAQAALVAVLEKEYSVAKETLEALDDAHEAALDWQHEQKSQPTELSHALKHAVAQSGHSQAGITRAFAKRNEVRETSQGNHENDDSKHLLPQTGHGVHCILNGVKKYRPTKFFTYAIEQICKPNFSLRAIHENSLRERADQLWEDAKGKNSLGGLIKACRMRLGESRETFVTRIGEISKKEGFGTGPTGYYWETKQKLPKGNNHQTGQTLYEPMVQAMKLADKAKNGLSISISTPWFDDEKENTFREVFTLRVKQANQGPLTNAIPGCNPVECPDPKIHPKLGIYDGNLAEKLVNAPQKNNRAILP
jgi:hypothetical protein